MFADLSSTELHAVVFIVVAILVAWVAVTLIRKA